MSSKRSFLSCGICKRSPSGKRATDQEGDNLDPKCSQTSSSTECLTDSYPAPGKSSTTHEVPDPINTPTAGSTQDDVNDKGSSSIEAGRKQATGTPNSLRGQQQLHLLKRRSSASLLQTVLRRKMSRESHLSQSSKRDSQISWTEEDIERHVERRKALESRLRDDLIASGKLEERSRVENTDMLDTPSQRSKSPSLANTVGMISPQACDGSFDGRPEHPARPGIKERSQDSELQIAAGNVLKEVRRAQEGEDEREPIPEKEQILENLQERREVPSRQDISRLEYGNALERSHSARSFQSQRKLPATASGLSRMPRISEYVPADWRLSIGSRQRSGLHHRPTVLRNRNGNFFEDEEPTSRHQQGLCAPDLDKVADQFKPAARPDDVDELSEAMSQIVLPTKENFRSISSSSSLPQIGAVSRSTSVGSSHTQIHRAGSGYSKTRTEYETTWPLTLHGLDGAKILDELKELTSWAKGQQTSSTEVQQIEPEVLKKRGHAPQRSEGESLCSTTDDYRAQELAAADRIVPQPPVTTKPRKSNFREEFGPSTLKKTRSRDKHLEPRKEDKKNTAARGLDGSDDLRPPDLQLQDRRPSDLRPSDPRPRDRRPSDLRPPDLPRTRSFQLATESSDAAAGLWERALKNHAWEMSAQSGQPGSRKRSVSPYTGRPLPGQHQPRLSTFNAQSASDFRQHQRARSVDTTATADTDVAPDEVPAGPPRQQSAPTPPAEERPSGRWARYPSHNRHERTASAGCEDQVSTVDFAARASSDSEPSPERSDKRDSARSRGSKHGGYLQHLGQRYRAELTKDWRRAARGYRSSVSSGGSVPEPELELLPRMEPVYVAPRKAASAPEAAETEAVAARAVRQTMSSEYGNWDADRSSEEGAPPMPGPVPRSASGRLRVYRDCVDGPQERGLDDDSSAMARTSTETTRASAETTGTRCSANTEGRRGRAHGPRPTSSESAVDVRESTVDFQRSLRLHEAESLRRVLRAAEQVWG